MPDWFTVFAVWFIIGYALAWIGVNVGCWYFLFHREFGSPWNWRVLLGSKAYRRWEES